MDRRAAIVGTLLFVLVGTGLEAVVAPAILTGWRVQADWPALVRGAGVAAIVLGGSLAVETLSRLALDGGGTPSPAAPTAMLVARGSYRVVRHPMYVGTALLIAGQGLLLGSWVLLGGAGLYLATMALLALAREEPRLLARHGAAYAAYRDAVPAFLPSVRRLRAGPRPRG